ncbi:MAG: flagellar basal body P-ring formation chaperone FlgA [Pirellulaceae bacterium]
MPSVQPLPRALLIVATALLTSAATADGAEVVLKAKCPCSGAIVRLGDVADIHADIHTDDQQLAERLAHVELFPTPAVKRYLDLEQLKSILSLRSVNLAQCTFRGSSRIEIVAASNGPAARVSYRNIFDPTRQRVAEQRVEDALVEYLEQNVDGDRRWQVEASVTQEDAEAIAQRSARLSVAGGSAPWTGSQQFDVTVHIGEQETRLTVPAEVATPQLVVVARRQLRQGEVIQQADVEMQPAPIASRGRRFAYAFHEIVGKELSRGYSLNQPIDPDHVRAPQLVRRNDVITVYAIGAGLRIRILGKALEDGALGDVIAVADHKSGKPLRSRARVTAFQTVEVYALGPQASAERAPREATPHFESTYRPTTVRAASGENQGGANTGGSPAGAPASYR